MWNLDSDRPIYQQLVDEMKKRIITAQYQSGQRLPSVRELADDANVNPNTMQRAMTELERIGLVYSQRTNGRYITENTELISDLKNSVAKKLLNDFIQEMKQYGYDNEYIVKLIQTNLNQSQNEVEES